MSDWIIFLHRKKTLFLHYLHKEILRENVEFTILRVFIGTGWIRAFFEKWGQPDWINGEKIRLFLETKLEQKLVAFPFYERLISDFFLAHAGLLAWIVMVGQLLCGIAITLGVFTNIALLMGIFMNLNFILAGAPNPSAFYVIIQLILRAGNAGAILGMDEWISKKIRNVWWVSQEHLQGSFSQRSMRGYWALAILLLSFSCYSFLFVRDFSPEGSVHDPAMIMAILSLFAAATCFEGYIKRRCLLRKQE